MEKVLRSFIHEHFPLDIRVEMELIKRRRDIRNEAKQEEIIKLLQSNGMTNYTKLGPGTNRYAFRQDGFVVKIATDHDGQIDNFKEFKMTKRLYPDMSKTYEVATNGDILIAEYIQPFSSYAEMLKYADRIREKLQRIGKVYLLGDVGISPNNFANWGLRVGIDDPVCLDYAYVYDVSSSLFVCRECKGDPGILIPDKDYNFLYCSKCGTKKKFEDIRALIGNDIHNHEIGDLTLEGYEMFESNVLTELTESRSNYLIHMNKKDKKDVDYDNIKEEEEMSNTINLTGTAEVSSDELKMGITIVPTKVISIDEFKEELDANNGESDGEFIDLTGNSEISPDSAITGVEYDMRDVSVEETGSDDEKDTSTDVSLLTDRVFIRNGHTALSKISNRINNCMKEEDLFNYTKEYLHDKMMKEETFYNNLQRAILQSLASFLGCTEKTGVPNRNKPGTHTEYILPETMIGSEQEQTFVFIARMFLNPELKELVTPASAAIDLYYDLYEDALGIQAAWWSVFKTNLLNKIHIEQNGIYEIYTTISEHGWISLIDEDAELEQPEKDEDEEDEETLYEDEEEAVDLPDITGTYAITQAVDEPVEEDAAEDDFAEGDGEDEEETLQDIEEQVIGEIDESLEESGEEDGEDEEEEDPNAENMEVEIISGEDEGVDYDVIKVFANDFTGTISIPFYVNFDQVDPNDSPDPIDSRNGIWDWLSCFVPSIKFVTKTPERYMYFNDADYDETDDFQVIFIILDYAETTGEYLMGMYKINGFFGLRDDQHFYIFDKVIYAKINNIVKTTIGNNIISAADPVLKDPESIVDEEYIVKKLFGNNATVDDGTGSSQQPDRVEDVEVEEEEEVTSETEEMEVTDATEEEQAADMSELEAASMAALAADETDDGTTPPVEEEVAEVNDDAGTEDGEENPLLPDGVWGYLIEVKRNKSVNRSFYLDAQHIEKISGDQKELYVDITDGPNYGATYKWNGRNFLKVGDPIGNVNKEEPTEPAKVETPTPETVTPKSQQAPSKPGAIMPKRTRPIESATTTGAIKPKTTKN